jgi:hypothetical protein
MLNKLHSGESTDPRQIRYADDSACGGKLSHLQEWMSFISKEGEGYGYVLNPKKCIIVVPSSRIAEARKLFPHIPAENINSGEIPRWLHWREISHQSPPRIKG